jgi:hypothetical protein
VETGLTVTRLAQGGTDNSTAAPLRCGAEPGDVRSDTVMRPGPTLG